MGFEEEVYEYQEELEDRRKNKPYIKFDNNLVSCINVSIWKVMWEYICWVLGGKPEGYKIEIQKRK